LVHARDLETGEMRAVTAETLIVAANHGPEAIVLGELVEVGVELKQGAGEIVEVNAWKEMTMLMAGNVRVCHQPVG
jgi:hypothetical protein